MWQQAWGFERMPLMITESGADFALRWNSTSGSDPRGMPRPATVEAGAAYAYGVATHQIENIAIGLDRTYAFQFFYYEEGGLNYGMTGKDHTPLRGLAAYAAAVRFLQHMEYVGDLPNKAGPEGRGRVFANANRTNIVAAIYAGTWSASEFSGQGQPATPPGPMWSYSIPIIKAFGADGRAVDWSCSHAGGCQWANPDKLGWLTLEPTVLRLINTPTVASNLNRFGNQVPKRTQNVDKSGGWGQKQQHQRTNYPDCYPGQSHGPGYISFDECTGAPAPFDCAVDKLACTTDQCGGAHSHARCRCNNCTLASQSIHDNFACGCGGADCECVATTPQAPPLSPPPVILQMMFNNATTGVDHVQAHFGSAVAYTVRSANAAAYNLTILIHNMLSSGGEGNGGNVTLSLGEGAATPGVTPPAPQQQRVISTTAGRGVVATSFTVNIAAAAAKQPSGMAVIDVVAAGSFSSSSGSGGKPWIERLSLNFEVNGTVS